MRWKCAIAGGYVLLLTLALWLPGLLTVQRAYGPLDMAAQANSVQCLSALADNWTVGGVVLVLLAGRFLLLATAPPWYCCSPAGAPWFRPCCCRCCFSCCPWGRHTPGCERYKKGADIAVRTLLAYNM